MPTRTTDSLGSATATVLTVLVPHNADFTKVLSYQVAEDASTIDCAPSYAFQLEHAQGPVMGTVVTEAELLLVEAALKQGWIMISPDYLGPKAAFLANALAGYATLDGIRAAINSAPFTGISKTPTITMWGYSGGSLASLWAAELQPTCAPDLKIAGAAVGGTVPNITTVVTNINGKADAGLIPPGVIGLSNQYPELGRVVDQHLLPQFRTEFNKAKSQCFLADHTDFANKDVVGMFDDRNLVYTNPIAVRILAQNALGQHTPQIPLFVYKSVN
ncbi:Lipase 4 [Tolypocladium paradoxum]|uniref:Lipase 4 n=1 Tax=Tolypocladium paradoxum TaxID=94208 RepID=A0A2S4L7X8_9HYPO|nr:Lipase 4 [Tolypocladium paradoxum]